MSSFLLHGHSKCNIDLSNEARKNVLWLLHILEGLMYILNHPENSILWMQFERDAIRGVKPTMSAFPNIIKKHFQMPVTEFFTKSVEDDVFIAFETDCFNACTSLSFQQLKRIHEQMFNINAYSSL